MEHLQYLFKAPAVNPDKAADGASLGFCPAIINYQDLFLMQLELQILKHNSCLNCVNPKPLAPKAWSSNT